MFNPIKNKPIAQQRQIAEKQRQEQFLRDQKLKKNIESKRKSLKTESELLRELQLKEVERQNQLKREYYKKIEEENKD